MFSLNNIVVYISKAEQEVKNLSLSLYLIFFLNLTATLKATSNLFLKKLYGFLCTKPHLSMSVSYTVPWAIHF